VPQFAVLNRQNEILPIAPTGTAAFNVAGIALHSIVNLPIGKQKQKKISGTKGKDWTDRQYLIVDAVSDLEGVIEIRIKLK
jgi:hypothetical protein